MDEEQWVDFDEDSDSEDEQYEFLQERVSKKDVMNKLHFAMTTNLMIDAKIQGKLKSIDQFKKAIKSGWYKMT